MQSGADPNMCDFDGNSPVACASSNSLYKCVESLIQAGVDVNTHDMRGRVALMNAALDNNIICIKDLLNVGANVDEKDNCSKTTLMYTICNCHINVTDKVKCIETLVRAGADVNLVNNDGNTSLILALGQGNATILAHALIQAGADVNIQGKFCGKSSFTTLMTAAWICDTEDLMECIRLFLKEDAHINILNKEG